MFHAQPNEMRRVSQALWLLAIIVISASAGMVCVWLAPGLERYARDVLMRARGPLPPPGDIVIVAIDEPSMARLGRFPWPRDKMARTLEVIASGQPKVIALDVLYSEPTSDAQDTALAEAIARTRNTVVAAQLVEARSASQVQWLRPWPAIEQAAAAVGHINVATEADGAARELPLRKADNEGYALWSLAVETVRVADGGNANEARDEAGAVQLGNRRLLLPEEAVTNLPSKSNHVVSLRADRLLIDYIGPAGSFAPQTYSFADVLEGKVAPEKFRGKYVLVGATAATLGDHIAGPFVHSENGDGNQNGTLMPGVEVLANGVNTILRERFYRETPDWAAVCCAALFAAAMAGALILAQGRWEALKQLGALGGGLAAILALAYFSFTHWLIIPPLVSSLTALAAAAPLTLLRRSLATSADLDKQIDELSLTPDGLGVNAINPANGFRVSPCALIAEMTNADTVAIFTRSKGKYRLVAARGEQTARILSAEELLPAPPLSAIGSGFLSRPAETGGPADKAGRALSIKLGNPANPSGALRITYLPTQEPSTEMLRLGVEIAASYVARITGDHSQENGPFSWPAKWQLPKGVEWKARALGLLSRRLMARAGFVNSALRSVEDGLVIADIDGCIAFANPRAGRIFGRDEHALRGQNLFRRIAGDAVLTRRILFQLLVERESVEREITIGDAPPRYYILRLSIVTSEPGGAALGFVASLSDITKQRELQQTKNDVMALVTHELRTPLTAIQGMSEVLAQYEIEAPRRREMHSAINDEAKRLSRLINDYLDITRLESGARPLRLAPTHIAPLLERVLLVLEPLAEQQGKRFARDFAPDLPPLLVDADLIAQAVTNLVGNAIKYSYSHSEIVVALRAANNAVRIEVADAGPGIPPESLARVFEKFYRAPRLAEAEVSGTGLGLAFVREIAEKHGGSATVMSALGSGSVFSLRLPLEMMSAK